MSTRYAIYYVPPASAELYRRVSRWLGHSIHGGITERPSVAIPQALLDFQELTRQAAGYGFHATLKPPFRLHPDTSLARLRQALDRWSGSIHAVDCGTLQVGSIGQFLALLPAQASDDLSALGGQCVRHFDRFRAPLTDCEIQRRSSPELSRHQRSLLSQWGYPYVLDEFRFHMTLTDALSDQQRSAVKPLLVDYLLPALDEGVVIDRLSLCVQRPADDTFTVLENYYLA